MEHYIVSARKYRPMQFSDVVGQQALTTTLRNAIMAGKLAHAYLFCGPRGVGKTTCARIFARTINCFSPTPEGDACGTCESCRSYAEQRSYNIHELDAASNNSVEDIRSLIDQVRIPPQVGKYKVFIIDEVHMLSAAAFNAFLKTLEEPPKHAIFILATTEKHKILPTILSRCQVYDFNRMEVDDIVNHLKGVALKEGYTFEDEALNIIAQKADGGMRDALSIFDQVAGYAQGNITYKKVIEDLNVLDYDYYFKVTALLLAADIPGTLVTLNEILGKGFDANHFVGGLASHLRNLLVSKDAQTLPLLEVADAVKQKYHEQAQKCSLPFIYKALKLCNNCDINYKTSRNKRLLVEITLIEMAQATEDEPSSGRGPKRKILKPIFSATEATQNVVEGQRKHIAAQSAKEVDATLSASSNYSGSAVPYRQTERPTPPDASNTMAEKPTMSAPKTISIRVAKPLVQTSISNGTQHAEVVADGIGCKEFDEKELNYHWYRYAMSLPREDSAIANRMKNLKPVIKEGFCIEVAVPNAQVLQYMNAMKDDMLQSLKKVLNNRLITISFVVDNNAEAVAKPMSPRERFMQMMSSNKALVALTEKLGLELG